MNSKKMTPEEIAKQRELNDIISHKRWERERMENLWYIERNTCKKCGGRLYSSCKVIGNYFFGLFAKVDYDYFRCEDCDWLVEDTSSKGNSYD